MQSPTYDLEREHSRVYITLPVRVRPLSDREAEELARRFALEPTYAPRGGGESAARSGPPSYEQAALAHLVDRLAHVERTLELIATKLAIPLGSPTDWVEGETLDVGPGGAGFELPQRFPQGTPLEVELTLLGEPTATLRALARVAYVQQPDGETVPVGRFRSGVQFEAIHTADLDLLVRYLFRLQRAQIRELREQEV